MKIHLHVGPPKTGTTSLQQTLLTQYGAPEPQAIWYPIPERIGPGHADIIQRIIGLQGRQPEAGLLAQVAHRALEGGCQHLIISSEGGTGLALSDLWPELAMLSRYGEVQPIVTFQPIGKRIASYWQEMTKHLAGNPLAEARGDIARNLMELQLVTSLTEIFPGSVVSVIFLNKDEDPGALFRRFVAATELQLPEDALAGQTEVINRSVGRVEADLMASLSKSWRQRIGKDVEYQSARLHLFGMFQAPTWRAIEPKTPIGFPQDWVDLLAAHARTTIAGVKALQDEGKIAVFGDVERFDDVTRPYKWPDVQIYKDAPMVAASVILPVSRQGEALRPAADSALQQSLPDLELLIVGDDCDVETRAVANELVARDQRVRFFDNQSTEGGSLTLLHNAVGQARGRFVAYLDPFGLWWPNHLQALAGLLEEDADLVHSLQAALDRYGEIGFSLSDIGNPDLRHLMVTSEQFRFDSIFVGHRVDAYRRLPGGWHTVPADARFPDAMLWQQFLAEPWCRARSIPQLTGLSLRTHLRLYLPEGDRVRELRSWQARLADPVWEADVRRRSATYLNRQAINAQMAQWKAEAQVRDLEAVSRNQQAQLNAQQAQLNAQQAQLADQQAAVAQLAGQLAEARREVADLDRERAVQERRLQRARKRRARLKEHWAWRFTRPLRHGVRWLRRKVEAR